MGKKSDEKTYIGVLSSHDEASVNLSLIKLFNDICGSKDSRITQFHFIFTGGTFNRIIYGKDKEGNKIYDPVKPTTKEILFKECQITKLPGFEEGGVTILSYFITNRLCSIIWPFFSPLEHHWRRPENLAQWRLCDQWNVKRLPNSGSVMSWFLTEAKLDANRNKQLCPPKLILRRGAKPGQATFEFKKTSSKEDKSDKYYVIGDIYKEIVTARNKVEERNVSKNNLKDGKLFKLPFNKMTMALIAHDEMKQRMISFAIDHEWELRSFGAILATGTTGREVAAATSNEIDKKIHRYHSGPKGGDIEIATEILFGRCHIVIFFVDPLHPHPHIDDIRTVFEACMIRQDVLIFTNEMHAREFMRNVVRGNNSINDAKQNIFYGK